MDCLRHFYELDEMLRRAARAYQTQDCTAAGEFIWGAVVHGLSAADPYHETVPAPSRQPHNTHAAPYTGTHFYDAAQRVHQNSPNRLAFSPQDAQRCLTSGQQRLHNNFYHANIADSELLRHIAIARIYANRLRAIAAQSRHNQIAANHTTAANPDV